MVRIDTQSVVVLGFALMASFGTALTIRHLEGDGMAQAATPVVEAAVGASGTDAQVVKGADGHYWAEANIDGKAVRVLVDTGASVVALTRADALRLGVDPEPEAFTGKVQTASGVVRAAPVQLKTISVAGARVDRVEALVVEQGLEYSLLGMSYLGRLSAFSATPAGLTLRP
ncbi:MULTISPECIES: TIGR02281 family clan AA aspartic protease [Brevundimonas]|jgi:aspartyl protease family protein|uniref:Predicted aspartyl protease n=1 Tax=Brevundimonas vesicularis TaxID=41276 RepID=A0A2X1BHB5_BREVE|nr:MULTISPECIES: TIGR02281 family clan AA aspartic protease [Brevundimonas]MDQ1192114.1 aspartyl protease family protein [Brevundimonas vesicularis]NSX33851.1 TIGR02281 family clan AA aspartic protease [Brevundimonas vesicularis]QCQ99585.1 TIGR02281 family clan AA aspartic protease [Brevundimonas sp. SGAir0440]QIF82509.1 TIGR02281 family clan AA aspartic protease [Brevundimonas sp. 'scallop']SPU51972.1 Predicted aspartyl protease [Brevundimonas vesicularis]